ncbi:putative GTP binding domain, K domain-like, alpha/beta, GTPase Der KH-domain-containing protein [Helianthus annuus]|nr:putative GTP binding domain, K domain-like, alpha/beta, GTPase Der KH-domain-containing protein [Helianthus annuus]KAJ0877533.1 putative GTP binding domain, K domain-like, alpha/beta, GTPase Der KH-domain-containing protein [Helianthus annuus]
MLIITVMNKAESVDDGFGSVISAARTLRFGDPVALSAETGLGMNDLYEVLRPLLEQQHMLLQTVQVCNSDETNEEESKLPLQLAFVGRPNVGKSTLLNAILQEERVLVSPEASLTRDLVRVEFKFQRRMIYMVTDTYKKWCLRLSTARLNRWLRKVMSRHSWKDVAGQPKVKYFTQVKARPPTFVAFVSRIAERHF